MDKDKLKQIAIVIGHHFWKCENDDIAMKCGIDCAKEIEKEGLI